MFMLTTFAAAQSVLSHIKCKNVSCEVKDLDLLDEKIHDSLKGCYLKERYICC